jgi:hypothetical protein
MKWPWALLLIGVLGFCGVSLVVLFVESSQRGFAIQGGIGGGEDWTLVNADGVPAGKYGQVQNGTNKRLLTILFVAPGASGPKEQTWDSGSRIAEFDASMGRGEKRVDMGASWDKIDDVVTIEGREYDRRRGELFVVVKPLDGPARVWQLPFKPEGLPQDERVIRHLKKHLPQVEAVQAIDL